MIYQHPNKRTKILPLTTSHVGPFMQTVESCLHCQFLCRILKALFYQTNSKIKLSLQKNAKFFNAGGSAPRPPCGWGFAAPKTGAPLRTSGYAPGYYTSEFLRFCA